METFSLFRHLLLACRLNLSNASFLKFSYILPTLNSLHCKKAMILCTTFYIYIFFQMVSSSSHPLIVLLQLLLLLTQISYKKTNLKTSHLHFSSSLRLIWMLELFFISFPFSLSSSACPLSLVILLLLFFFFFCIFSVSACMFLTCFGCNKEKMINGFTVFLNLIKSY